MENGDVVSVVLRPSTRWCEVQIAYLERTRLFSNFPENSRDFEFEQPNEQTSKRSNETFFTQHFDGHYPIIVVISEIERWKSYAIYVSIYHVWCSYNKILS